MGEVKRKYKDCGKLKGRKWLGRNIKRIVIFKELFNLLNFLNYYLIIALKDQDLDQNFVKMNETIEFHSWFFFGTMKINWEEFYIEIIRIDARIYHWKKIERANIFLFDQFDFIYLIILQMQMATWIYVNFSKETGNIKNRRYQQWYIYISLFFSLSFATKVTRFKRYKFLRKENILPLCIPINKNYIACNNIDEKLFLLRNYEKDSLSS